MLININNPIMDGETIFKRVGSKYRTKVHEGGTLHLERMYASGGMVVSVFHNYATNKEEFKYDSIQHALEKYESMAEMRENSPEWVDEKMLPAILKAIRAAQRQEANNQGFIVDLGDPTEEDIEAECGKISQFIADARNSDPELDREMTKIEMEASKIKVK